jgi:hypothetical protein
MEAQIPPTPRQKELYRIAEQTYQQGEAMLRSFSGADQADSECFFCARRVYVAVAKGGDIEAAIAREDARWRKYAVEQADKVARAPKIKRGPMSGHSAISHRWVSPDKFSDYARHIRAMVRITDERLAAAAQSKPRFGP